MTSSARNSLEDLENYRFQLESNITKLRKALQHWQTWEIEYESLNEEILGLSPDSSEDLLAQTARRANGELLTVKEINELLGQDKRSPRSAAQVAALTSRRIEYVHRNVESLQKQVDSAELKLASVSFVIQPEASNEEGLPVTDIYEELDEDGNTISGKIVRPDESVSEVLGVLEKAGVKEEDLGKSSSATIPSSVAERHPGLPTEIPNNNLSNTSSAITTPEIVAAEQNHSNNVRPRKKSVSFAEGTKEPRNDAIPSSVSHSSTSPKRPIVLGCSPYDQKLLTTNGDDKGDVSSTFPVIPDSEPPEDAALRREMLQYHMSEVGAIVAQLDLLENEDSDSEFDEDESNPDSTSLTDDEDQHGMSMNRGLDDKYAAEMVELERKLGAQVFQNVGPANKENHSAESTDDERSSTTKKNLDNNKKSIGTTEKSVRFSDRLDVAPATSRLTSQAERNHQPEASSPMVEKVVERPVTASTTTMTTPPTSKPSRFKAARMANAPSMGNTPSPTDLKTSIPLASRIIEHHPTNANSSIRPSSPDEFDPALVRQQVATEYHRQRNRMIQKEGGFSRRRQEEQEMEDIDDADGNMDEGEDEDEDEDEDDGDNHEDEMDEPEPQRKVSLFKAARLKKAALK